MAIVYLELRSAKPKWAKPALALTEIKMLPPYPAKTLPALYSSTEMVPRLEYHAYAELLSLELLCEGRLKKMPKKSLSEFEGFYSKLKRTIALIDLWNGTGCMGRYNMVGDDPVCIPTFLNRDVCEIFVEADRLSFHFIWDLARSHLDHPIDTR